MHQGDAEGGGAARVIVYRIFMLLALPALLAGALWRRLRGRGVAGEMAQRLGFGGDGPALWLHGASNGEVTSARWLVAELSARVPGLRIVITSNTATARAMVQGWGMAGVTAVLAPYDTARAVARFQRRWQPLALLSVENEFWPERLTSLARARVPVIAIGARLSEGSARNWTRFAPGLMRRMLGSLAYVTAQDAGSEARLLHLGLDPARLGPRMMLKARQKADTQPAPAFAAQWPRHRCLLAASTHDGEDAAILDGFALARAAGTFDLLILAPRHPARAPAIATLITARGLACATRSTGEEPGPQTAVYLADTMGEMARWYAMAGVTFIGATLVAKGGHTPYEPAAHGSALIHGPSLFNFTEAFAALDAAGAARQVTDAASLAATLQSLDKEEQLRMADAARLALPPSGDDTVLLAAIARTTGLPFSRSKPHSQ